MSQADLAAAMTEQGVSWKRATVVNLEKRGTGSRGESATGRDAVTVGELLALALVLGVPPVLLLADPRVTDGTVPVAAGSTMDVWDAFWWITGRLAIGDRPIASDPAAAVFAAKAHQVWQTARDVYDMERTVRRSGARPQAQLDQYTAGLVKTLAEMLGELSELGVTELPHLPRQVLDVAERVGVELPGQDA